MSPASFRFDSLQSSRAYFSPLPISQPVRNTKEASAEEREVESLKKISFTKNEEGGRRLRAPPLDPPLVNY